MKRLLVAAVLLALAGCKEDSEADLKMNLVRVNGYVYRADDNEGRVTCWIYDDYRRGGISCLPMTKGTL